MGKKLQKIKAAEKVYGQCWTQFAAESAANQWKIELFFN